MPYAILDTVFTFLLDLLHVLTRAEHDKTVELLLLRQQLRIYQRRATPAPRLTRWDKVALAALGARYRRLAHAVVLVKPETVLRWHRAIVKRKWTYRNAPKRGRPTIPDA